MPLVYLSAYLAFGFFLAGLAGRWTFPRRRGPRLFWSLGCFFMLLHFLAAFHFFHHWDMNHAYRHAAQRTMDVIGWEFPSGLLFNFVFLPLWFLDAVWWWRSPAGYEARPRLLDRAIQLWFLFFFLNATVVFAQGWGRAVGGVGFFLLGCWWILRVRPPAPASV